MTKPINNLTSKKNPKKSKIHLNLFQKVLIFIAFLIISFTVNDNRKPTFIEKTLKEP